MQRFLKIEHRDPNKIPEIETVIQYRVSTEGFLTTILLDGVIIAQFESGKQPTCKSPVGVLEEIE